MNRGNVAKTAQQWRDTLASREKKLKEDWLETAKSILDLYDGKKGKGAAYNILYANTETLLPALYNSLPRPEVSRRYTARDPMERQLDGAISQVAERTLEFLIDTNDEGYESFDSVCQSVVFDSILPGMGQARARYKAEDGGYQTICWEHIPYDRFLWGFARKWEQVPWVAFGHDMTKEHFEATFPAFTKKAAYKEFKWAEDAENETEADNRKQYGPTILVWEAWDHATQQVSFVSESFSDEFILQEPYPCHLSSRFPCPKPLYFVKKTSDLVPKPLYTVYQTLAEDLDDVTKRLARVIRAIRVRGVYNSQIAEFEKVLGDANDNALIPSENANTLFTEKGGLEANVWLMPIEMLVKVAQQLYVAQANIKQTIFELMGISDIQRGSTAAGETASAQTIKDKWSNVRLRRSQREVATFCRALLRVGLEMAAELFTPATLFSITRLPYPFQPVPEGPPSWPLISQVMRDQLQRTYRVDIETNSTVDLEATEDKESIAEFMNAFGQMMAGFKPILEQQILDPTLLKEVMLEVTKRYRFGRRIEGVLEQMQPPQQQQNVEEVKAQAELALEKQAVGHEKNLAQYERRLYTLQGQLLEEKAESARLSVRLQEAQSGNTLARVEGKIRENELTADFSGKIRSKDQQIAEKMIETKLKDATNALQRIQDAVGAQMKETVKAVQQRPQIDPELQREIKQQYELLLKLIQTMSAPRKKTIIEDEQGNVIGVEEELLEIREGDK